MLNLMVINEFYQPCVANLEQSSILRTGQNCVADHVTKETEALRMRMR